MNIKFKLLVFSSFFMLFIPFASTAADLKNFVSDLWGGDGITLDPGNVFHEAHFTGDSLNALKVLDSDVSGGLWNFPFNSTAAGYSFDVASGLPVKGLESLGPLLAERATTLGKGILNIGFSYINIDYDKFNGDDIDDLKLVFTHDDCCGGPGFITPDGIVGDPVGFENDTIDVNIDLELERETYLLVGTFGLTDTWDIGAVIPIVHMTARSKSRANINNTTARTSHTFGDPPADGPTSSAGGSETGIGDIILRSKYNFIKGDPLLPDLAFLGTVSLPTGDEDDLIGSGDAGFEFLFAASRQFDWLTPHLNLGYELSTGNENKDNFRYIFGADAHFFDQLTTAIDIIGNWRPHLGGEGNNLVDVAFQTKWNPFGNTIINGFVIIPINKDDGLRSDAIWSVGLQQVF